MAGSAKQAGRLPDHERPLGPVERRATLTTLRYLRDELKMRGPAICSQLATFSYTYTGPVHDEERGETTDLPHFHPDETSIRRAMNKDRVSDPIALALNLWLKSSFSHLYQRHLHDEMIRTEEVFVQTSRAVLGGGGALKLARIRQLGGDYKLIRPHHLDPRGAAISEHFRIGGDRSPYECRLISKFLNDHGRPSGTTVTGRIVPHSNRLIALMGNTTKAQLIIHLENLEIDDTTDTAVAMRGIMTASVGNLPSSAYPLQCIRLDPDEDFEPHVLTAEEVSRLPKSAREALTRGTVFWRQEDYRPFGRKR